LERDGYFVEELTIFNPWGDSSQPVRPI